MILSSIEKKRHRQTKAFADLRQQKLISADFRCQLCGVQKKGKQSRNLHIHHIDESKYAEPDEDKYTIVVCAECHEFIGRKEKVFSNPKHVDTTASLELHKLLCCFSAAIKAI